MTGSILVAGNAKTGTTGVYHAVKSAVRDAGEQYHFLFEPTRADQLQALFRHAPQVPVLTKVMATRLDDIRPCLGEFGRRVMTVRDPRDTVVSTLLFRPMVRRGTRAGEQALARFVDALREKERDPSSWSVCALHQLADELDISSMSWKWFVQRHEAVTRYAAEHEFHVLHYEAFVDGRLDDVGAYLGLPVKNPEAPVTGTWLSHITRSRSHGAWRHWFTAEDVERLTPLFEPFLTAHGYDPAEPLDPQPHIDPASSSEYVERTLARRRSEVEARYRTGWSVDDVTEEEREQLRQRTEDGDVIAALRMALVYRKGNRIVAPDQAAALEYALRAAVGGSTRGMRIAAELLRERQDAVRARYWANEAASAQHVAQLTEQVSRLQEQVRSPEGGQRTEPADAGAPSRVEDLTAARDEAKALRRELAQLRGSTSYRLGSALVRAVRAPVSVWRRHSDARH